MRIAVTGASGHIGTELCQLLVHQNHEVRALVHKNKNAMLKSPIEVFEGSVLNRESLLHFFASCDAVIHAAGAITLDYKFNQELQNINVIGTKNVLEAAKEANVQKVIVLSSVHVFCQKPCHLELNETGEFVDDKAVFYDQTKRDAHILALQAAKNGQNVTVVCPTGVIGPNDFMPSKVGKAVIGVYKGYMPAMIKGGFNFVDVRDVAHGISRALEIGKSGESYILGGKYYSLKELAELILKIKGKSRKVPIVPKTFALLGIPVIKLVGKITKTEPFYTKVYLDILEEGNQNINCGKAENELGFSSRPLENTLKDTINWFKKQGKL